MDQQISKKPVDPTSNVRVMPAPAGARPMHDERVQRALIALAVRDKVQREDAVDLLEPKHFGGEKYQRIWEGVLACEQEHGAVDVELLVSTLERMDLLPLVGGEPEVRMMVAQSEPGANARAYATTILEYARRRTMLATLQQQAALASSGNVGRDWLEKTAEAVQAAAEEGARPVAVTMSEAMALATMDVRRRSEQSGAVTGISTGMPAVDLVLAGLHRKEVLLVGGRSGGGKSSLTRQWAVNIASTPTPRADGTHVLEGVFLAVADSMTKEQIATAVACTVGGVDENRIRTKRMVEVDDDGRVTDYWPRLFEAADYVSKLPILVHDDSKMTVRSLYSELRMWKNRLDAEGWDCHICGKRCPARLSVVVFDTVQRFGANEPVLSKNDTTNDRLDRVGMAIEKMALHLNFAAVAITQLNKDGGAFGAPSLKTHAQTQVQLKTAKSPPKDAVRRDRVMADLHVEKQRHGEEEARIPLWFVKHLTKFEE